MNNKADYYIALIGKNPLPNYISALNFCCEKTEVFFVYTEESYDNIGTIRVAENIIESIKIKINNINPQKIPCDKSDNNKILECVTSIMDKIIYKCKKNNTEEDKPKVILDYTGATKSMAAIFFDSFGNYQKENKDIEFNTSYVAQKNRLIYETSFDLYGNDGELSKHTISDLSTEFNINVNDIVSLHGYRLEKTEDGYIILKDKEIIFKDEEAKIVNLEVKEFTLNIIFETHCEKVKQLVDKFFYLNDISSRIGGSEVKLEILTKSLIQESNGIMSNEDGIDRFYENVSNISSMDNIKKKVKVTIKEGEV